MSKIHFKLDHVLLVSIDDSQLDIPTEGNAIVNLKKPKTKVTLLNTQPVYVDPDMVGYVDEDDLIFEK